MVLLACLKQRPFVLSIVEGRLLSAIHPSTPFRMSGYASAIKYVLIRDNWYYSKNLFPVNSVFSVLNIYDEKRRYYYN